MIPFNGQDFSDFSTHLGFRHERKTPLNPQANAEANAVHEDTGEALSNKRADVIKLQTSSRKRTDFYASTEQLHIAPPSSLPLISRTPTASSTRPYPSESLLGNTTLTSFTREMLKRKCKRKAIRTTRGMSKPPTTR